MGRQAKRQEARRRARESMPKRRLVAPTTTGQGTDAAASPGCPRCGAPVQYAGRGRRPIWCSARCRTAASIERCGNRIVGVQPKVVQITRIRDVDAKPATARHPGDRRQISEWVGQLGDLHRALVSGSVYKRELEQLVGPLNEVLDAFRRRSGMPR